MKLTWDAQAWATYVAFQKEDPRLVKRINALIKECLRHPFDGTGKPEPLRGDLSGYWSRRIDQEHRLVYKATSDAIIPISCRYHYG